MTCKTHPDAPHGFDRNASHSQDRYVCECESWEPPEQTKPMGVSCPRCGKTGLQPDSIHTCTPRALVLADALDNPTIQAGAIRHEIAAELRRLHAENEALWEALERERASRQAAQIENVGLKDRIARSGVEQQRAVREATNRLHAENEELRADQRRLDWMDQHAHCADWVDFEPTKRVIEAACGSEFTGDTWRDAIDAALARAGEVK